MPEYSESDPLLRAPPIPNCKFYIPIIIVLILVFLEKVAFYSLSSNLFLFLNEHVYSWTMYNSMSVMFIFTGVTYISCLCGGIISDTLLGKYASILIGFMIFTTTYWFLPFLSPNHQHLTCTAPFANISQYPDDNRALYDEMCVTIIVPIIVFAAVGSGMVQSNVVPFGAAQGHARGPDFYRMFSSFYYWSVNLGGLVAILGIAYIQTTDFYVGYLVPAICISVALVLCVLSYPLFRPQPRNRKAFSRIFNVLAEAYRCNRRFRRQLAENGENVRISQQNRPAWLDMAKVTYMGRYSDTAVEDVKSLKTIFIVFLFLVPYWVVYFQMQTSFFNQGLYMRLSFKGGHSSCNETSNDEFQIPAAWLTLFDVFILLLFIPLMDRVIYPFLDRHGLRIPLLCRMKIGMLCASFSMFTAAIVEHFREKYVKQYTICQKIEDTDYYAADMTIFWQIPQYLFMGMSEIFASIGAVEFACSQSPDALRSVVMGIFYFCTGIGSFFGTGVVYILQYVGEKSKWTAQNMENGAMAYYFFYLGVSQCVTMLIFCYVSRHLRIRRPQMRVENPISPRVSLNGSLMNYDSSGGDSRSVSS